ncbi:MAG: undecaprenyl-diphosphate phosphatase [Candidatus Margulisiibacteriota bacterium]
MMTTFQAILLGILEGITEFIPVSSTGHLFLAGHWMGLNGEAQATFEIAIQLGAILAVVVLYRRFFLDLLSPKNLKRDGKNIALAIVPALVMGALTHSWIKHHLFSVPTVIAALFVGGVVMTFIERVLPKPKTTKIEDMTSKQALTVGFFQCFALWPGMSRSASTIIGGLLSGLDDVTAAQFSFIIAVPVMVAATGFDLLKTAPILTHHDLAMIGVGLVVSFAVAVVSIGTFLKVLKRWKLFPFGVYRVVFSGLLAWYFFH